MVPVPIYRDRKVGEHSSYFEDLPQDRLEWLEKKM
jgi:hypothetical protein